MTDRRREGDWEWQENEKSRVFLPHDRLQDAWGGDRILKIDGEDAHHLARVLRLRSGDPIVVADGVGSEWPARIERVESDRRQARSGAGVWLRLLQMRPNRTEPPIELVLIQGIPKGEKMDQIVQKSVEAGVTSLVPVLTRRSVPRYDAKKASERTARWTRIAKEAAKQSRRGRIPAVEPIRSWEAAVRGAAGRIETGAAVGLVAWEMEARTGLASVLKGRAERPEALYVCIGPEGGLHSEEVATAKQNGFQTVALGPRILRTETAGLVALSIALAEWGDLR